MKNLFPTLRGAQHPCRYCNVPFNSLSDPAFSGEFVTQKQFLSIQASSDDHIKKKSYKKSDSAFTNVGFGGCRRGIHGNTPPENVHALRQGLIVMVLDGLYGCKKVNSADKKRDNKYRAAIAEWQDKCKEEAKERRLDWKTLTRAKLDRIIPFTDVIDINNMDFAQAAGNSWIHIDEDCGDGVEELPEEELELARQQSRQKQIDSGVFAGDVTLEVNFIAFVLGRQLQHQSDRELPRVYFPRGVVHRKKIQAHEQVGLLLITLFIITSSYCQSASEDSLVTKIGTTRHSKFVQAIEWLLMIDETLCASRIPFDNARGPRIRKSDLPHLESAVRIFLETVKTVVDRQKGDGHSTIKFHLLPHMIQDIARFGLASNVSGSAGESQFLENFKIPASTTQLRDSTFDQQMYNRQHEIQVIHRASQLMQLSQAAVSSEIHQSTAVDDETVTSDMRRFLGARCEPQPGDLADDYGDNGLSCHTYTVLNVSPAFPAHPNSLPPAQLMPEILYMGKHDSKRAMAFKDKSAVYLDSRGKKVGTPECRCLGSFNPIFAKILDFFKPVLLASPHKRINLYTSMKKNGVTYRADPFTPHQQSDMPQYSEISEEAIHEGNSFGKAWNDWALFVWEENSESDAAVLRKRRYPGQISIFFLVLDDDERHFYSSNLPMFRPGHNIPHQQRVRKKQRRQQVPNDQLPNDPIQETGAHCLVVLTKKPLYGFLNPRAAPLASQEQMHGSRLLYWEKKERWPSLSDETDSSHIKPPFRMRPISAKHLELPVVAVPDISPHFDKNKTKAGKTIKLIRWTHEDYEAGYTFLVPRNMWHRIFLMDAREIAAKESLPPTTGQRRKGRKKTSQPVSSWDLGDSESDRDSESDDEESNQEGGHPPHILKYESDSDDSNGLCMCCS